MPRSRIIRLLKGISYQLMEDPAPQWIVSIIMDNLFNGGTTIKMVGLKRTLILQIMETLNNILRFLTNTYGTGVIPINQ
ncbi:hypothetical protein CGZ75_20115 [Paenibacillus herberti]|uniref:Uncharacterized protein n=1 Tax=Paenibacillus herberti TaxID=1619309 RepID=A0A229NU26_9BACL|nr:hypothetical protein CGZ75_20115 [Paenibacillus herberti]